MRAFHAYRLFDLLKGVLLPLMTVVLLGSQFPLSPHCYEALFSAPHSGHQACMMDGVCMTSGSGGMAMHCDCHENNGDRPFYCSCDASGKQLISGVQISKVLLPSIAGADHTLDFTIHTDPATTFATQFCLKDIFHPPQFS